MTIPQALQIALQHHQAGRLADAETLYRQILTVQPNQADALHFLGVLAQQTGHYAVALEWIRQAIALKPNNPAAHSNLGGAYRYLDRLHEAIASYGRALALNPDIPETQLNLGNALIQRGQPDEAITVYRDAIALHPELTNIGLSEQVAHSEEDYVEIAATLAENLPRLADLRATMCQHMRSSPLTDAPRFARNVEAAYRSTRKDWVARQLTNRK